LVVAPADSGRRNDLDRFAGCGERPGRRAANRVEALLCLGDEVARRTRHLRRLGPEQQEGRFEDEQATTATIHTTPFVFET